MPGSPQKARRNKYGEQISWNPLEFEPRCVAVTMDRPVAVIRVKNRADVGIDVFCSAYNGAFEISCRDIKPIEKKDRFFGSRYFPIKARQTAEFRVELDTSISGVDLRSTRNLKFDVVLFLVSEGTDDFPDKEVPVISKQEEEKLRKEKAEIWEEEDRVYRERRAKARIDGYVKTRKKCVIM